MKPLVSIIVVNLNGLEWLRNCFSSLHKQNHSNFEIILADNNSNDGSVEWVKNNYPKTIIVENKKNLGFARANNFGLSKTKGAYVLFLNNDTRVTKTFLTELIQALESDETIGGAQSKILLMDRPGIHDCVGAFLTPTGFLYHYGFGAKDRAEYNRQIDLYTAKGACMIFRKSVLTKVAVDGNIFDPDYFAYFEETDLCHRVWVAGYRIVYAHKSVIYHKMGATSSKMNNAFIQFHSFKNRIRTYIKNLDGKNVISMMLIHLFLCEMYSIFEFFRGRIALALAIQRAMWWNIVHLSSTLAIRKFIQNKVRRINDDDILKKIFRYPSWEYYRSLVVGPAGS